MSLGINNNVWINPYMWNSSTAYGNQFDFSNSNLWAIPTFGSTNSSSKSDNDYENKYMIKSDSAQNPQLLELKQKKLKELNIEETQNALKETRAQVVNNKKADGSSSIRTPRKKSGFWSKAGRWLSNGWEAVKNIGKSLVGIEKDGSWNWKKCLRNVAITAAAVGAGFIPVVGPAISTGLLYSGVALGAYGAAKGTYNFIKANKNDDEAIDNAQQEIFTGAITAITSAYGLRGLGKGVPASNASMAAERTSVAEKTVQNISQFSRDITVNAWKATGEAMKADKALITGQNGGKFSGFFKAYGKKIKNNTTETAYTQKQEKLKAELETKMNEINTKLATETNASKKALLEQEKLMLEQNIQEFNSIGSTVKTKADYEKLIENNASKDNIEYAKLLKTDDFSTSISTKRLEQFNKSVEQFQKSYNKKLAQLIKTKKREMYSKAGNPDKYTAELNEFVPTRNVDKSLLKPSTWRQNEYQRAIGKTRGESCVKYTKIALLHPTTTVPKAFEILNPIYTTPFGFGGEISSDQYDATLEDLDSQIKMYEQLEKQINNCKNIEELEALTKTVDNKTVEEKDSNSSTDVIKNNTENEEET